MHATITNTPVLSLSRLSKSFGGSHALRDVDLDIMPGEVHGLLGENGSGKSTLIKILSGFHHPEAGAQMSVGGEDVSFPMRPGQFRDLGLAFVHQDLGLAGELSVLENLRIGDLIAGHGRWIAWRAERARARETFARYGLDIDPAARVQELSPTERALLAIVRAVEEIGRTGRGGGLLVLDEPTVFLPKEGTDQLFGLVRQIVAGGNASVLFVSHDLTEVLELTDRVTVLRDGRIQGTVDSKTTTEDDLIEMIIGRRLGLAPTAVEEPRTAARPALAVRDLTGGSIHDLSFDLGEGEILGVTGLMGSGFDELVYYLFGARQCVSGRALVAQDEVDLTSITPRDAVARGVAMLPSDRQNDGSVPSLSVADNMTLLVLDQYRSAHGLRRRALAADAEQLSERYDVRPRDASLAYESLSGGNQQKALLAKWLQTGPKVILLHEPTQGVDIGAREQIFGLLGEAAAGGAAILVASSDYEQLAAICHRVLILAKGRISAELTGSVGKERVAELVYNSVTLQESTMEADDEPA